MKIAPATTARQAPILAAVKLELMLPSPAQYALRTEPTETCSAQSELQGSANCS